MPCEPWFIKYRPKRFSDLVFSSDVHIRALRWLKSNKKGGILHITGNPGAGKTSLVFALAAVLKYNVIELSDENVQSYIKNNNSTLNKRPNLLLIDESAIQNIAQLLHNIQHPFLPVIITSCGLYTKNIPTLKIEKLAIENVLQILQTIYRGEGISVDNRIIGKISERNNYDIRSIISYVQLYSKSSLSPGLLQESESISNQNIFYLCSKVGSKRLRMNELESIYVPKLAQLCLSSVIANNTGYSFIASALIKASEISMLPHGYEFLELAHLNQARSEFLYHKEDPPVYKYGQGHLSPLNYLSKYVRNKNNRRSSLHLKKIFEFYNVKDLSPIDEGIINFIDMGMIESKVFRYKYNVGSSNSVRRDVNLREVMEY